MPAQLSHQLKSGFIRHGQFPELTYASDVHTFWQQIFIRLMENMSGRGYFADYYKVWKEMFRSNPESSMSAMLSLLNIKLNIRHGEIPAIGPQNGPLMIIANHPFGIADGVAILSIAEKIGRPYRILINSELTKVPEIRPFSLPIRFDDSREAIGMNLETRQEAIKLLREGVTIIVFPAGGVATATAGFGKAHDLPWKRFPAKLIQATGASVLPVYFEGQCSTMFHLASRFSETARTALLIREFRKRVGKPINAHIGNVIQGEKLMLCEGRDALTEVLHHKVFSLAPSNDISVFNQNRPL